jgi:hypothetical protein
MAEGRMLTRRVSRSTKLADLSSDTARMIYSWLIPYTDVEGRMEADPRLLKADIAPLLDHITPEVINNVLLDCARVGLIILYTGKHDGKAYLQVTKFEANQKNLRKDREAPSQIPGPEPDQLQTNSGATPEQLGYKRREEKYKLREAELSTPVPTEEQSVDNSKPEKIAPSKPEIKKPAPGNGRYESQEKFIADVQEVFREIEQAYPGGSERRQVQLFVERNLQTGHRGAIVHSLRSLVTAARQGIKIENVGGYIGATFKIESAKYNARDHEAEAEVWKKPLPAAAVGVLEKLGLKGFGGGA